MTDATQLQCINLAVPLVLETFKLSNLSAVKTNLATRAFWTRRCVSAYPWAASNVPRSEMAPPAPNRRYLLTETACACCGGLGAGAFAATTADRWDNLPTILELGVDPTTRIPPSVWVAKIAPSV